jgi:4-alpha-glucanotransferase
VTERRALVRRALEALGKKRLVCAVHDRSLPARADEDTGVGALGSEGTNELFTHLAAEGFDGVQLGPAGRIDDANLSPYDGTVFARSELALALAPLIAEGLVEASDRDEVLASAGSDGGTRIDYARAFEANARLLERVHAHWDALGAAARAALDDRLASFREAHAVWLVPDALHRLLSLRFGTPDARRWPVELAELYGSSPPELRAATIRDLTDAHRGFFERHARIQLLTHEQHTRARAWARSLGLSFCGDLQAGLSLGDRWSARALLLGGYAMGAPPSRTNPEGQPWGYPVLDPRRCERAGEDGPALELFSRRVAKIFDEYDTLRIDHPHALVCPWVYREDGADAHAAVRAGTRLFETPPGSPRAEVHAELGALAIARLEQLDLAEQAHADAWVRQLDEAQIERYAILVDRCVEIARARGRSASDVVCEVLSTQPFPLAKVLARHGLGRFRVTQKASERDPLDVYAPESARREDWIMVGTHDTPPIWRVAERWLSEGRDTARARWSAARLSPEGEERQATLRWLAGGPERLATAELASLFASEAENVMVFVSDVLGERAVYNEPGTVNEHNWTLRVPRDFERLHRERAARGQALDLPGCLAVALRARGMAPELSEALAARASGPLPWQPRVP